MIQVFYLKFYKILKNECLCIILAKLAYGLYLILFAVKRCKVSNRTVNMSVEKAHELIGSVYSKPNEAVVEKMAETNPEIDLSIIIPVYNCEQYLESCIQSVVDQKTQYSFEIIIVNDGSTDGSEDIIHKFKSYGNYYVVNQQNMGAAAARNAGIIRATGKYIMFVDGDDTLTEECVEQLLNKAFEKDYDIVMCAHDLVRINNRKIVEISPVIYPDHNLMNYKNGDEIMNYPGFPWGKVYRRELFEKIRFFPGYWYEDTIIQFLLFAYAQSFIYLPYIGYQYKLYENNTTSQVSKTSNIKCIDRYGMLMDIIDKYHEIGLSIDEKFYTLLLRHVSLYYYTNIKQLPEELVEALFVLAREQVVKYKPERKCRLPLMLKVTERAILNKKIEVWKLASKYQ